jgi:hypothetical protein
LFIFFEKVITTYISKKILTLHLDLDPATQINADPNWQSCLQTMNKRAGGKSSVVDPELFAGSGSGSGLNHFGSGKSRENHTWP